MIRYANAENYQPGTPQWRMANEQYRQWLGNQIWTAASNGELDPNNKAELGQFLGKYGATQEKGGGLHTYNLFMGNLGGSEGNGLLKYKPSWVGTGEAPPQQQDAPAAGMDEASKQALMQKYGGATLGAFASAKPQSPLGGSSGIWGSYV